jgi:hypothetical protein
VAYPYQETIMDSIMFVVTFVLGALVLLVAVVALFKKKGSEGGGSLEFGGFKLAGTGAPSVFLLVGVVLMLTGVNGYAAINKNHTLTEANADLTTTNSTLKTTVAVVESTLVVEQKRTGVLVSKLSPQQIRALKVQHKNLFPAALLQNPQTFTPITPGVIHQ